MDCTQPSSRAETGANLRRRGLIAGAAALAVGLFARSSEQVAAAGNGSFLTMGGGALDLTTNAPSQTTTLNTTATVPGFASVVSYGAGIRDTTADAVQGFTISAGNAGVLGRNDDLNGTGVVGVASNGSGVYGQSTGGSGLVASSTSGAGVYSTTQSGTGVYGSSSSGVGISGVSGTSYGVYGSSTSAFGVAGVTSAVGYAGLIGATNVNGASALSGAVQNPAVNTSSYAGNFGGNVVISGTLMIGGGKAAAVSHPDGFHRLLYCVEAPDSLFEDVGEGKIVNGRAEIALDPEFARITDTNSYQVFVTPHGDFHAHIAGRGKDRFQVQQTTGTGARAVTAGGTGGVTGTFSWRVVAKRADIKLERFARVKLPPVPTVPEPPKVTKPDVPRRASR